MSVYLLGSTLQKIYSILISKTHETHFWTNKNIRKTEYTRDSHFSFNLERFVFSSLLFLLSQVCHRILPPRNGNFFNFLFASDAWQTAFPKTVSIYWTIFLPKALQFSVNALVNWFKAFKFKAFKFKAFY